MIRLLESAVRRIAPPFLVPLLCFTGIAVGQAEEGEGYLVHRGAYLPTVRRERERALLAAYHTADAEGRAAAEAILRAGRDPRAPELQPPDLAVLASAMRALSAADREPELHTWQEFADSIDLRVAPGAFEARLEGRGEYTTVHFTNLWEVGIAGDLEIVLWWIAGDGRELRARGEGFPARSLREGFEMYIRPPVSDAARWTLVAELHTPKGLVRTGGVPIDCVPRFAERIEALQAADSPFLAPLKGSLAPRLRPLVVYGVRTADALPLFDWFVLGEGKAIDAPLRPVVLADFDDGLAEVWELTPAGEKPPTEAILILTSRGEHPTDLLAGASREVWTDFRDRTGRRVLVATLRKPSTVGPEAALLFDHLRGALGIEHLVVVARGTNGLLLPPSLKLGEDHGVDALVLAATPAARVAPRKPLGIPVLQIDSDAAAAGRVAGTGPAGGEWLRVSLTEPALFTALKLPELIAEWLDEN